MNETVQFFHIVLNRSLHISLLALSYSTKYKYMFKHVRYAVVCIYLNGYRIRSIITHCFLRSVCLQVCSIV